MSKFVAWLEDEARGMNVFWYVLFAALVVISLDYSIQAAVENWGLVPHVPMKAEDKPFDYLNVFGYISMFLWGPVKEEMIFRVLPLTIVIAFISTRPGIVFGCVMAFAALFGAIHPYSAAANVNIAIDGFFFGLVFLKCGGLNKNFVKASASAMAAHGLTNMFVVFEAWYQYYEVFMR